MQVTAFAGCSLLLAVLPWSSSLQESGFHGKPPPRNPTERAAERSASLLGAWQLVSASIQGSKVPALDAAGYLLVVEDYLSMELHLVLPTSQASGSEQPFFQSATRRWRFTSDSRLETSALIGNTNLNPTERWDFDRPGMKVLYQVVLSEVQLVLERPGDSKLTFRRLPRLPFPGDPTDRVPEETEPVKEGAGGGR